MGREQRGRVMYSSSGTVLDEKVFKASFGVQREMSHFFR